MKRYIAVLLAGMLVLALMPGAATAGKKKKKKKKGPPIVQEVDGAVISPAPYTDDSGCYAGLHRRISVATQSDAHSGLIGYEFDVDPKSWNQPFAMEIMGDAGDLDIYFYSEFGDPDVVLTDPLAGGSPYTVQFSTRDTVGEEGTVPPDMTKVIICMLAGGSNASFKYTAGSAAKLP